MGGVVGRFFLFEPRVEDRQHDEGEQGGTDDAADHDGREGPLHLGAGTGGERHRDKAQTGDGSRHEHRAETGERAFNDGVVQGAAFLAELIEVADEDNAVQYSDAGQRDKANRGGDTKGHGAQPESSHAAGDGERDAGINEQRLPHRAEGEKDEHEDERESRRNDDGEAGAGLLEILKLPAELNNVAFGELHLGGDGFLGGAQGKVNPAFGGGHSAQGSFFSITFNRSFLQGVRTAKWQRTALVAGKIPPNNLSLSAAILIDKADKLDARHVAGAVPLPPPAKRDPVVELRSHPGLSANLLPQSGCPTWIRTMTRRVKVFFVDGLRWF